MAKQPIKKQAGPDLSWFINDRLGMFIHWGTYSLAARHEWVKSREEIPDKEYQKYFNHFDPDLYDPKEWARLAKAAGMKYFVITTKHHEGFCLWDTKYTDYKAPNTPHGKDVLTPMVEAFRNEGIRVGFYYSLIDWHHPEFPIDKIHPMRENKELRKKWAKRDVNKYAAYMRNQVTELLTDFGKIDVIWFDFSYPGEDGKGHDDWESKKLIKLVRSLQPGIMVNNRLDLPGDPDFATPEQYQPIEAPKDKDGKPMPWEACQTLSGSWGYHRDELTWKSVPQLLWMLIDGVSKGGNLLLNVGPTGRGEIDYRAKGCLEGMAEWMKHHARSIHGCGAAPKQYATPPDCRYTYDKEAKRLYLHVLQWPFKHIHLPNMAGKLAYAQFLHDHSEVLFADTTTHAHGHMAATAPKGTVMLDIPVVKPNVEVPVIELFLK